MRTSEAYKHEIATFSELTGLTKSKAQKVLAEYNFNIEQAAEAVFGGEIAVAPASNSQVKSLNQIFDNYVEPGENFIGLDGTLAFIEKVLKMEPEDAPVLAVAMELKSPEMGKFTKAEFCNGWFNLGAFTEADMEETTRRLGERMNTDLSYLKQVYTFTFNYTLQPGTRVISLDTAFGYWDLLLSNVYPDLPKWTAFMQQEYKRSAVSKDTWNMLFEFINYQKANPTLDDYDETGSWPSVIDDYVDFLKKQNN